MRRRVLQAFRRPGQMTRWRLAASAQNQHHTARDPIRRNLWDGRREELQQQYQINLPAHWHRTGERLDAARRQAQAAVKAASEECRSCGWGAHDLQHVRDAQVLWVGWDYTFVLDVPINLCQRCGEQTAAQPLQAGCFPSTPVHAWDLCRAPADSRPLWFDLCMLEV